jgi:hypothetical protein
MTPAQLLGSFSVPVDAIGNDDILSTIRLMFIEPFRASLPPQLKCVYTRV